MKFSLQNGLVGTALAALLALLGAPSPGLCQTVPAKPDLAKTPTLYAVGYTHLDTEWCWSYPQVINEFIPNTLHQNFALFEKYPDYVFNWTGANRYKFMKEYYPADYATLKKYVASGHWYPNGSSLEEGDVDIPSEESIIRQVMYGNEFFRKDFGVAGSDFMLPDCFGFPASLPSILAHCGVDGFSTQKLSWGSAVGIPFNVGVWDGADGTSVFAALNPVNYYEPMNHDYSHDADWIKRVNEDGAQTGIFADYRYYGIGDRGGSVLDSDGAGLEASLHGGGPLHIVSSRADQIFKDLSLFDTSKLPHYKGDLLLTFHSSGSATSQAEMKRWNHENEKLADATERASVAADWLGALPYDKARITDAWWKFLPGQFHDLMAGTALPKGYEFAWNDQVLALNEFSDVLHEAVGGITRGLDTTGAGVPVVVYNPLSAKRQDIVMASVSFPGAAPSAVQVVGPDGMVVPSQIQSHSGGSMTLLFLASAPSIGAVVYHVRPAAQSGSASAAGLKVTTDSLENARFRVKIDANGDVAGIYDKKAGRELLSAPMRLAFQYENPGEYPAWNMDYEDQRKPAEGYVDGPAKISVTENGPARVAVQIDRWARGSHVVQTVRLASGLAGDRVELAENIDWQTKEAALKAVMPLTVSNPMATYNWELGTIQRSTNNPRKYEVPSHQWFDLTDTTGAYGVSVLSGDRYGSDKPDNSTLRLTLVYTPGVRGGYHHQATQDFGHHELSYAITGHQGSWQKGGAQWQAMRFDRPLIAFQATPHSGLLGKSFSFVHTSTPNVSVEALKQAEASHEVIVRFNELSGQPQQGVTCSFAAPILSAREVNGQEKPLGKAVVKGGALVFNMAGYRPRAFAVTLGSAPGRLTAPLSREVSLPYNANVTKPFGSASGGSFDAAGNALPADMLPASLVSGGVRFSLAASGAEQNAVECKGQSVVLPSVPGGRLYLLAASDSGDVPAAFTVMGRPVTRTIQSWNGKIGQWDNRVWGGHVDELTYDMLNPVIGLTPGFIKRDPVAWFSDHLRAADGTNQAYQYCYLFRYAVDLPAGCKSVTLPDNSHVKILAATVASNPDENVTPAQPLYDTLSHPYTLAPHIDAQSTADGGAASVSISPPLYFTPDAAIHYTLDGTTPTAQSAVYAGPLSVSQTAVVKAAYLKNDGTVVGAASANAAVEHPTPPQALSVTMINPQTVTVTFSEPVTKASAENAANYAVTPAIGVSSAALNDNAQSVTLTLAAPLPNSPNSLAVHGVQSAALNGLSVVDNTTLPIPGQNVTYQFSGPQSFDGTTDGVTQTVNGLPLSGEAAWTMNLFAYFDKTPGELTTLAGFGDDSDNNGTQRYLLKFHDGIHFWASNVDVTSGVPYDLGKWQMVTATYDGKQVQLYKNGQFIKSAPVSLNEAVPVVKIAPPGPWPTGNRLNGKIAGFRIWNAALSSDQITALMQTMPKN